MADKKISQEAHRIASAITGAEKILLSVGTQNFYCTVNDLAAALALLNLVDPSAWLKSLPGYLDNANYVLTPDGSGSFKWQSVL